MHGCVHGFADAIAAISKLRPTTTRTLAATEAALASSKVVAAAAVGGQSQPVRIAVLQPIDDPAEAAS